MKKAKSKKILLLALPFAASAVLLTVIQPPFDLAPLAWVALVPFILACSSRVSGRRLFVAAYLVGLVYWLANLYWIVPITVIGWLIFCLYTAPLWPILALILRYCRSRKIPLFLAAAVLVVGTERMQGLFLGGFFWRFLGHSQYRSITIIQIADIFGAGGVSFLVAMVNGLVAELIIAARQRKLFKISNFAKAAVVLVLLAAAGVYGRWRISQQPACVKAGPVVGAVQSNVPQSVKRTFESGQQIFDALMPDSKAAADAGAQLIVWPETMVQAWLSPQILALLPQAHPTQVLHNALRSHAKDTAYVLVGAYGGAGHLEDDSTINLVRKYNSAFLYNDRGEQDHRQYDKIHLVPFGEVLPLRRKLSWFYEAMMKVKFIPYNFDYSLDYGTEYTIFEMPRPPQTAPEPNSGDTERVETEPNALAAMPEEPYRFAVMICYEDVVPKIARKFALDRRGRKRIDWLVNISNDGWFVRFGAGSKKVYPSTELAQHAAICAFRAVENRLAVVRSVNTGISCVIDSFGRIRDGFISGSLPQKAMSRTGMAGWFNDTIPIDNRVTFFSKYGQYPDFCCEACVIVFIIVWLFLRLFGSKKHGTRLSRRSNETYTRKS
ncbi:MAG: apolipoprotein N-acyltransferase [Phycisphaerales bacterium]|nr:MAG: apolipoprotein N-acyltransferase [Phycisphaerales bacterium]